MIKNSYSLLGYIQLVIFVLRTKLISTQARIIRFPIEIRGKRYIDFGYNLTTGKGCRLEAFSTKTNSNKKIIFHKNVQINDYVHISAMERVTIGDNVLMASHIYISDNSHGFYKGPKQTSPTIPPIKRDYFVDPVTIGKNVWLGEGVVIMPGVEIGEGCIIGANSTVTKSIPNYSIAVGQPAKIIKQYNFTQKAWLPVQ